jgi:hypothetical protein
VTRNGNGSNFGATRTYSKPSLTKIHNAVELGLFFFFRFVYQNDNLSVCLDGNLEMMIYVRNG